MNEIIFIVKESPEGGYEGRALRYSIFAEGDTYDKIKENIRDAIVRYPAIRATRRISWRYESGKYLCDGTKMIKEYLCNNTKNTIKYLCNETKNLKKYLCNDTIN